MDVLVMRHATAVTAVGRLRDEDRWLTDEGRASALRVGERMRELGIRPSAIYTSPLVRAVQTAELASRALEPTRLEVHPPLAIDGGTTAQGLAILDRHQEGDVVLLVSHEPKVRSLAGSLGSVRSFPAFATAGVSLFRGPRNEMRFALAIDPRTLAVVRELADLGSS